MQAERSLSPAVRAGLGAVAIYIALYPSLDGIGLPAPPGYPMGGTVIPFARVQLAFIALLALALASGMVGRATVPRLPPTARIALLAFGLAVIWSTLFNSL